MIVLAAKLPDKPIDKEPETSKPDAIEKETIQEIKGESKDPLVIKTTHLPATGMPLVNSLHGSGLGLSASGLLLLAIKKKRK